jgi:diadenosine tetraphosphatase ApaH/serine/threonine PP2A family protein phosphatase
VISAVGDGGSAQHGQHDQHGHGQQQQQHQQQQQQQQQHGGSSSSSNGGNGHHGGVPHLRHTAPPRLSTDGAAPPAVTLKGSAVYVDRALMHPSSVALSPDAMRTTVNSRLEDVLLHAPAPPDTPTVSNRIGNRTASQDNTALHAILGHFFSLEHPPPPRSPFNVVPVADLLSLIARCGDIVAREPTVVDVHAPAKVFGDIHGQFGDLLDFFRVYGSPNHKTGDVALCQYVFNGDFVDRGEYSLEVIVMLMALKVRYPARVILLRGNHECASVNAFYGFRDECAQRLGRDAGLRVWSAINLQMMDWLPLAAVIGGKIVVVHGGVGRDVATVQEIRAIERPLWGGADRDQGGVSPPNFSQVVMDILWSDPTPHDSVLGAPPNPERGNGGQMFHFGPDRVSSFLSSSGCELLVRSHQCVDRGYLFSAGGRCITVFSSSSYCGYDNDGAFLEISLATQPPETAEPELLVTPKVLAARKGNVAPEYSFRPEQHRPPTPPRVTEADAFHR